MKRLAFVFLALVVVGLLGFGALQLYVNKKAEEQIRSFAKDIDAEIELEKVSKNLFTGEVTVKGLVIKTTGGVTKAQEVVVKDISPKSLDVEIKGIRGEDEDFAELESDLRKLGYEQVSFNAGLKAFLDKEVQRLQLERFYWELPEGFRVFLSADLLNVDADLLKKLFKNNRELSQEELLRVAYALSDIKVRGLVIEFTDEGLITRAIETRASQEGKSPEEVKKEVVDALEKEFPQEIADPFKKLIQKGGSVVITSDPNRTFKVGEFLLVTVMSFQTGDLSQIKNSLGLKIEHKEEP